MCAACRESTRAGQGVSIKKQRGANAVAVAKQVRRVLNDFQKYLPKGMTVGVNFDSTSSSRNRSRRSSSS